MYLIVQVLLLLVPVVLGLGQNATISLTNKPGLLQLGGKGLQGQIVVSPNDWWGVIRAAEDLAFDFGRVTGTNLTLGSSQKGPGGPGGGPGGPKEDGPKPGGGPGGASSTVDYEYREPTSNTNVSS